ncbi:MAG: DUF2662 domain-containing protein [Peptococcaceae bacterium]|nr:MAG: DUF2662 domain-containing protein [Peptococcaceae bacterium]
MGMLSGLEGNLEKYIEGFFKDKFGGLIQPVEIAKRLARVMRDHRRVSVSKVYVPNEFTVYLSTADWETVSGFSALLARELGDYVEQKASEKRFTLTAAALVSFDRDEKLAPGRMRVEARFGESPSEEPTPETSVAETTGTFEQTRHFQVLKETDAKQQFPATCVRLVVTAGPERGKSFTLKNFPAVIGRQEDCAVIFSDNSVSRYHARLEREADRYFLADLHSTNGTTVNGGRIARKMLRPGDTITLGNTVCTFKVE